MADVCVTDRRLLMYSLNVTSIRVLPASICTSAVFGGHPEPRRLTPTTRTVDGGVAAGATSARGTPEFDGTAATRLASMGSKEKDLILV